MVLSLAKNFVIRIAFKIRLLIAPITTEIVYDKEKILKEMEDAQKILLDNAATTEEKNAAYETLQQLNYKKGKIVEIEKLIKEKFEVDSCVKIEGNKINITLSCEDKGAEFANNVIKEVQTLYNTQMYITIKFQSK